MDLTPDYLTVDLREFTDAAGIPARFDYAEVLSDRRSLATVYPVEGTPFRLDIQRVALRRLSNVEQDENLIALARFIHAELNS